MLDSTKTTEKSYKKFITTVRKNSPSATVTSANLTSATPNSGIDEVDEISDVDIEPLDTSFQDNDINEEETENRLLAITADLTSKAVSKINHFWEMTNYKGPPFELSDVRSKLTVRGNIELAAKCLLCKQRGFNKLIKLNMVERFRFCIKNYKQHAAIHVAHKTSSVKQFKNVAAQVKITKYYKEDSQRVDNMKQNVHEQAEIETIEAEEIDYDVDNRMIESFDDMINERVIESAYMNDSMSANVISVDNVLVLSSSGKPLSSSEISTGIGLHNIQITNVAQPSSGNDTSHCNITDVPQSSSENDAAHRKTADVPKSTPNHLWENIEAEVIFNSSVDDLSEN